MMEESMSNLTSTSAEFSASSGTATVLCPQQSLAPTAAKKKRNLPGNPDPDAEVIALSPKTLLATNRFICEICNKGFQRDQNLQLHRRGHNLPWKLKQRANKEVTRKKVYVCPETTCVHHDPSRALGDLTGIKKHFCRKHGEKKWKCEKCSKTYAVQSDWKAHSKICGTREYRCDCGTLFSRRDSFVTHRAFCDALAEESARALDLQPQLHSHGFNAVSDKREEWLELDQNPSQTMSATALLQKAAQMGVTMSQQQPLQSPVAMQTRPGSGLGLTANAITSGFMEQYSSPPPPPPPPNCLLNEMMCSLSSATGFEQSFNRTWNSNGAGNGTTRDFLGLKAFPHRDQYFPNLAELKHRFDTSSSSSSSTHGQQNQHSQTPWQG
ncbi:hypothetical protein GQ457_12G021200 [Hibiscus cannabinus]